MNWMRISDAADPRLAEVANSLERGEIAVIPTETVYGLAATLHPDALLKVFHAKGRPDYKPLIVGVNGADMAKSVTSAWPAAAQRLAEAFWPGPLSLILPKAKGLPLLVTAGGETVAVRAPAHPIAMQIIRLVNKPLVLTSANRSERTPPITAAAAVDQLAFHAAYVVDAGPAIHGVASTVYDVAENAVLRKGVIGEQEINSALSGEI